MTKADIEIAKQKEFVLRTLEERDIRFVRLWFTDVLGFLKSVAIAPPELEMPLLKELALMALQLKALPAAVNQICC